MTVINHREMEAWRVPRENSVALKTKLQGAHQSTLGRVWSGQASEVRPTGGGRWGTLGGNTCVLLHVRVQEGLKHLWWLGWARFAQILWDVGHAQKLESQTQMHGQQVAKQRPHEWILIPTLSLFQDTKSAWPSLREHLSVSTWHVNGAAGQENSFQAKVEGREGKACG